MQCISNWNDFLSTCLQTILNLKQTSTNKIDISSSFCSANGKQTTFWPVVNYWSFLFWKPLCQPLPFRDHGSMLFLEHPPRWLTLPSSSVLVYVILAIKDCFSLVFSLIIVFKSTFCSVLIWLSVVDSVLNRFKLI